MVSPERSALNDAMARLKANLLRCCQSIIAEFTRKMSPTARRYWYLSIGCGLIVGPLTWSASASFLEESNLLQHLIILLFLGSGFVFGAGFAVCLRAARVTSLWRASAFAICIGAAHLLAWLFLYEISVLPLPSVVAGSFLWGLVFGTVVASCAAFLFASVRSLRLLSLTVLSSVVMALSNLPLRLMITQFGGGGRPFTVDGRRRNRTGLRDRRSHPRLEALPRNPEGCLIELREIT